MQIDRKTLLFTDSHVNDYIWKQNSRPPLTYGSHKYKDSISFNLVWYQ